MTCEKCGSDMSEDSLFCNKCGSKQNCIDDISVNNSMFNNILHKLKNKKKVLLIISCLIIISIIFTSILILFIPNNEESFAIICVKALKTSMKDPNSIQIHEILYTDARNTGGGQSIYIDITGNNSFNGTVRKEYEITDSTIFKDSWIKPYNVYVEDVVYYESINPIIKSVNEETKKLAKKLNVDKVSRLS